MQDSPFYRFGMPTPQKFLGFFMPPPQPDDLFNFGIELLDGPIIYQGLRYSVPGPSPYRVLLPGRFGKFTRLS